MLITVFLATDAYAFSTDFQGFTTQQVFDVCACSWLSYNITVVNTGDFDAYFVVNQEGALARYSTLSSEAFHLLPGEVKLVKVYVNVPCNIKGSYWLVTRISNDLNQEKYFKQLFRIRKCSYLGFNVTASAEKGCRCSTFSYSFYITNKGFYREFYNFETLTGLNASFSSNNISLEPGSSKEIYLQLKPPCSWTTRRIPLIISTKYTEQKHTFHLELNINESCAAEEYEQPSFGYSFWIILGLCLFVLLLLIVIINYSYKRARVKLKKPKLHRFKFKKRKLPWLKILVILLLLVVWGLAAYFAYLYIPRLFVAEESTLTAPLFSINATNQTAEQAGAGMTEIEDWVWFLVAFLVLFMAAISVTVYSMKSGKLLVLKRALLVVLVLYLLGSGCCYLYRYITPVVGFVQLYLWYFVAGILLLAFIVFMTVYMGKQTQNSKEGFTCEICGRSFKTKAGLARHQKAKH